MSYKIKFKSDTAAVWTSTNPILAQGEMGIESDTNKIKIGDGATAWSSLSYSVTGGSALTPSSIGSTVQAYDADLAGISNASTASGTMIVGNGTNFAGQSAATTITSLGTGDVALEDSVTNALITGSISVANGGTGATDAATARSNLGLAIGTNVQAAGTYVTSSDIGSTVQAYDSNLTSFVSAVTLPTSDGTAGQFLSTNGSGTLSFASVSGGVGVYSTEGDLPESPSSGDLAFVTGTNQFYIYSGSAWQYISTSELSTYSFQGSNYGYASGGDGFPAWSAISNVIEKFSFTSDGNATDVGDLTAARASYAGQSSTTHGYTSGGYGGTYVTIIDKFPFSTDTNATYIGDRTLYKYGAAGHSSETYGYTSGGFPSNNSIDKFPFSTDANATDVGDLTVARYNTTGQSSTTHGYTSGGDTPSSNVIDKFPFATDANATDVGDLSSTKSAGAGQSSTTHGYNSGGTSNTIDKFSFTSDENATSVGTLSVSRTRIAGQSSTASGYSSGGDNSNVIDKFPFATDADATDVGDLIGVKRYGAGQQY